MANSKQYTFGRGEVHFARFKPGTQTPDGFKYIGNTPAFGFTINSQTLDHFDSDHGVGELDLQIATQVTRTGSFTTDNISIDNLALFLFGSSATVTSTSATAVTETIGGVQQGRRYQVGVTNSKPVGVRAIAAVTVAVASSVKVAGTDYLVDLQRGTIDILEGGAIANNADIIVTWNQTASSFEQVVSGNQPVEGAILFVADNPTGANRDYLLPYVKVTPNGEFALKSDNALQSLPFNLSVLKAASRAAFYVNGQAVATA